MGNSADLQRAQIYIVFAFKNKLEKSKINQSHVAGIKRSLINYLMSKYCRYELLLSILAYTYLPGGGGGIIGIQTLDLRHIRNYSLLYTATAALAVVVACGLIVGICWP